MFSKQYTVLSELRRRGVDRDHAHMLWDRLPAETYTLPEKTLIAVLYGMYEEWQDGRRSMYVEQSNGDAFL